MRSYIFSLMTDRRQGLVAFMFKGLLWAFSCCYALGLKLAHGLYILGVFKAYKAPKPVISIGNITVGGTGKTPLVIWLARQLMKQGLKPAILTRGYMAGASVSSDEAAMIRESLPGVPVYVGADRAANIRKALTANAADLFICDDAFQHWRLKRDLDIVVVDSVNPFGNRHLLPRGVLREPLNALKRASVFVLTKTAQAKDLAGLKSQLQKINPSARVVESSHESVTLVRLKDSVKIPCRTLKGARVAVVCAIADPGSFEASLRGMGAKIERLVAFMDHHAYTAEEMSRTARDVSADNVKVCVTTHKDADKIRPFLSVWGGIDVVYLSIDITIRSGQDEFIQQILSTAGH